MSKYVAPPADDDPRSIGGRGYELMRELAARGHHAVIVTSDANHLATVPQMSDTSLLQQRDGLLVLWLRTMKSQRPRSWRRVVSWLHFEWRLTVFRAAGLPRPDVIVVSSLSLLTLVSGVVLSRRHRCRLVVEIRDIWPLTLVDEAGLSPRNALVRLLGWVERFGYRRADAIVGTMPNLAEHVEQVLGDSRPTYCIPMGYAPRDLSAASEPAAGTPLHLPGGAFVVGYAGTVGVANALGTFFDSARAMAAERSVHFVVLGDGPLLEEYRNKCVDLSNVTFVPKVPKSQVAGVLARCDVLYIGTRASQRYRFGQSLNKLIDYLLAGKPIVASYSGYRSMIDEAGCGSFVPAEDVAALVSEIRRYAAMPDAERRAMGARGREWVILNRSFSKLAAEYEPILFPG